MDVGDDTWLVKMIDPAVKRLYTHRLQKDTRTFCSMGGYCVKKLQVTCDNKITFEKKVSYNLC